MTFAQTWDVGYGAGQRVLDASGTAPADMVAPELAAVCSSSVRQVVLAVGPESAKGARDFTKATLREWGLDGLVHEAALIASELVTNAIRHGSGDAIAECQDVSQRRVELCWQRQTSRVICIVIDHSTKPPVLGAADSQAESGRGLQVVAALAATWGWMMLGARSKAVWAALGILS